MQRTVSALIVAALLGLTGLYATRSAPDDSQVVAILRKFIKTNANQPDQPNEWHGRIDYAKLDQQFAAMAQRSEMAGLAVAIVEDGELRFVRGYGVVDRNTNVPVTLDTVFRWASVSKTVAGMLAATLSNEGLVDLERPGPQDAQLSMVQWLFDFRGHRGALVRFGAAAIPWALGLFVRRSAVSALYRHDL